MDTLTFERRPWSYFGPDIVYSVRDEHGQWLGEVARFARTRQWWASNKSWTGGADLPDAYPTRTAAAEALRTLAGAE
jgi:hypothetical protein